MPKSYTRITTQSGSVYTLEQNGLDLRVKREGTTELRQDGEWLSIIRIYAALGEPMELLMYPLSNNGADFTYRATSPVTDITVVDDYEQEENSRG